MPALKPTNFYGEIVWLGLVPDEGGIRAAAHEALALGFDGPERRGPIAGATRPSCVRVKAQHPEGTEIANVRQLSDP